MSCNLGFSVGESFAEIISIESDKLSDKSANSKSPCVGPARWFLPRRSLADGLREHLTPVLETGGSLTVVTSLAAQAFGRRFGSTPAFLVTAGFEQWMHLQSPILPAHPNQHPKRAWSPLNDDHIFGITERVRSDGTVETAPTLADLEFLISKLELLKIKTIAVAFLHADINPTHERQVRDFFRERGFEVFCSHDFTQESDRQNGELARWGRTAYAAYIAGALREQHQQIESVLGEHRSAWEIRYVSSRPLPARLTETPGIETAFGLAEALSATTNLDIEGQRKAGAVLHLGLERFALILPGQRDARLAGAGSPTFQTVRHQLLDVQPTSAIEMSSWPIPVISENPRGYEPGPMAFGKSLQPTVLDILFALQRLENVESFTPLLNEKARPRILESIFTLTKNFPDATHVDSLLVARDLETMLIERIHQELLVSGFGGGLGAGATRAENEILLTGALARSLHPRLEARRPDLRFRLAPQAEWAEALAAARLSQASLVASSLVAHQPALPSAETKKRR